MERAAQPEQRRLPVEPETLAELHAQLALPVSFRISPISTVRH
jgi:hypothetical protein